MSDQLNLGLLAKELQALEADTFEIVDYQEVGDLLGAVKTAPANGACSTSSTSTCSGTTSTTSCCA